MKLKLSVFAALVAGVVCASASTASPRAGTNVSPADAEKALFGDPVIVQGKGFDIKRSALDEVLSGAKANAAAQGQQVPPDFDISILNQLITIQVLLQKATVADRAAGALEASTQYTNLLKRFPSPEAFERQLQAVGMTVANLRAKATQEAVAKATLRRELGIVVTDEDAKDYYTKHPADFEQPELAHCRLIMLMTIDPTTGTPLLTNTIAAKKKQIAELRKRAVKGEDFAALAKEYSEDPGSKENGGELPEFPRGTGRIPPEFEAAAFALTNNQVSEVVATANGFFLIKLLDKTPAKKIEYAKAEADIKEGLSRQQIVKRAPDYVKKLRAEYNVEILDPVLKAQEEKVQAAQDAAAKEAASMAATSDTNAAATDATK